MQRVDGVKKLTTETLGLCGSAYQDDGRACGALLTCVSKCRVYNILDSKIDVSVGGHDDRVLTRGLAKQRKIIAPGAEELCRLVTTGEDQTINLGVRDQNLASLTVNNLDELQNVLGNACFPHDLSNQSTSTCGNSCRLEDNSRTCSQTGKNTTGGNSRREVPRRNNHGQINRLYLSTVNLFQVLSKHCVVIGKVDSFRNLGITLIQSLAGLSSHNFQKLGTVQGDFLTNVTQYSSTLSARETTPNLTRCFSISNKLFSLSGRS